MAKRKWTKAQREKHAATWKAKRANTTAVNPVSRDALIYLQHAERYIMLRLTFRKNTKPTRAELYTLLALDALREGA